MTNNNNNERLTLRHALRHALRQSIQQAIPRVMQRNLQTRQVFPVISSFDIILYPYDRRLNAIGTSSDLGDGVKGEVRLDIADGLFELCTLRVDFALDFADVLL